VNNIIKMVIGGLAVGLLSFLVLLTFTDVIARNVFSSPLAGATELTELALAGLTFLLYPILALEKRHLVVDLFDTVTPERFDWLKDALGAVVGAVVFGILTWRLWILAEKSRSYGDTTASLGIPLWPVFMAMAVLSGVTAIAFLLSLRTTRHTMAEE
jgi:TRAP-type C4-dicarboxylate transport system permease small subunit|tara:strand:+ start:12008 stop:12478 length:471 start_codon:yes stop_codon:yes gene_type:complete